MLTNRIRAMLMSITYLAKRKCGSIEDFASCTWRSTLFWHLLESGCDETLLHSREAWNRGGFELEHVSKFVERCRCHLWEQTSPPGFSKSCCRNPRIKHQKKSLDACGVVDIHSKIRTLKKQGSPLHLCRFFSGQVCLKQTCGMWRYV